MNIDRSLAFTSLLEWPEFCALEQSLGSAVVGELVLRFNRDAHPKYTMWDAYLAFRKSVGEGNLAAYAATAAAFEKLAR